MHTTSKTASLEPEHPPCLRDRPCRLPFADHAVRIMRTIVVVFRVLPRRERLRDRLRSRHRRCATPRGRVVAPHRSLDWWHSHGCTF